MKPATPKADRWPGRVKKEPRSPLRPADSTGFGPLYQSVVTAKRLSDATRIYWSHHQAARDAIVCATGQDTLQTVLFHLGAESIADMAEAHWLSNADAEFASQRLPIAVNATKADNQLLCSATLYPSGETLAYEELSQSAGLLRLFSRLEIASRPISKGILTAHSLAAYREARNVTAQGVSSWLQSTGRCTKT